MPIGDFNPIPKPKHKRGKPTQKQLGDISVEADKELKERSRGVCELCMKARAAERAHITGRKKINHKTTADDLLHLCTPCHNWFDRTPEGIRKMREIREIGAYEYLNRRWSRGFSKGHDYLSIDR